MVENGPRFARSANVTIGVVIYDGVEPIDIGGTAGVLSMARRVLPNLTYRTIAEKAGPVTLAGGLVVIADSGFDAKAECDRIIVCGGPGWSVQTKSAAMLDYLKRQPDGRVASVCTGRVDPRRRRPARRPHRRRRDGTPRRAKPRRRSNACRASPRRRKWSPPRLRSTAGF